MTKNQSCALSADATGMAQFRFALIAPVLQGLFPDETKTAYYKRITENPLTLPNGVSKRFSFKTLENWEIAYRKYGFDGLLPITRKDKGSTRALSDTAIEEIFRLKKTFPRLNSTQIHHQLIADSFISPSVSVSTVQRFIRKHDLKSARNPNMIDRKAFEEASFGCMWQADTCYLPHITEDGHKKRVYCIMVIDDHSRLIVGGGLFYNDNAYNFQKVLKNAVSTYGIPDKLYVDNGAPYSNEQLSLICGSIGTVLLHTRVRDGASKAKIERQFRTLKERWLYTLDIDGIRSLDQFNRMLTDYIRAYNTTLHTGIGSTPMDRFQKSKSHIRHPFSADWVNECFMNRITRKVNNDSTVSIDRISYDVPMQFIRSKVEIRYLPDEMDSAYILHQDKRYPIRKTDRVANCHTKRANAPSIDYSRTGGNSNVL